MEWILANWDAIIAIVGGILTVLTQIVTVASLVANLTPTEHDNKFVEKIGKIVNVLALNFMKFKKPQ